MPIRLPTHRPPTHPGVMLLKEFLKPLGITGKACAAALELPYGRVNKILNGRARVTPGIAYRLSKYTGTTPDFWVNGQLHWDLWHARRDEAAALERIQPLVGSDYPDPEELADEDGAVVAEAEAAAG